MLNIADIGSLSAAPSLNAGGPRRLQATAKEFDAMVLELLLRQSGILQALSPESDASAPMVSEMFLQDLARNLAAQMNLGFGNMLIEQSRQGEHP